MKYTLQIKKKHNWINYISGNSNFIYGKYQGSGTRMGKLGELMNCKGRLLSKRLRLVDDSERVIVKLKVKLKKKAIFEKIQISKKNCKGYVTVRRLDRFEGNPIEISGICFLLCNKAPPR